MVLLVLRKTKTTVYPQFSANITDEIIAQPATLSIIPLIDNKN